MWFNYVFHIKASKCLYNKSPTFSHWQIVDSKIYNTRKTRKSEKNQSVLVIIVLEKETTK